jgi:hypothetical protein
VLDLAAGRLDGATRRAELAFDLSLGVGAISDSVQAAALGVEIAARRNDTQAGKRWRKALTTALGAPGLADARALAAARKAGIPTPMQAPAPTPARDN